MAEGLKTPCTVSEGGDHPTIHDANGVQISIIVNGYGSGKEDEIWWAHQICEAINEKLNVRGDIELIKTCPECGSGDVDFCQISVRPHCNECGYWSPINHGSKQDAIKLWNDKLNLQGDKNDQT